MSASPTSRALFLSTPSARRATQTRDVGLFFRQFLSTPSARRATTSVLTSLDLYRFLSTPSARRATVYKESHKMDSKISIHALREEGDSFTFCSQNRTAEFLSTPSARRATQELTHGPVHSIFLSTPSARRATAKTETKSLFSNKLYNILHEFRRALIYNGSKSYPNHAK